MDDIPFVIHHDIHQILGVIHGIPSQLPQSFCKYGSTGNPEVGENATMAWCVGHEGGNWFVGSWDFHL